MKILIFIKSLNTGGAERQAIQDANNLALKGHQITIIYAKGGLLAKQVIAEVSLVNINSTNKFLVLLRLITHLLTHRYNAILSHLFWANRLIVLPALLSNHKVLTFEHGLGLWRNQFHKLQARIISFFSTHVITCSHASMIVRIQNEGIKQSKLLTINNSYNRPLNSYQSLLIPTNKALFKICFMGRFDSIKQLSHLVEVAKILKVKRSDFQFILIGDGPEMKTIQNEIDTHNLYDNFILSGYIDNPHNIVASMDCFVLPSKREDFSVSLLEASAAALPCIAYEVGGNGEIIIDNETGYLIKPYDIPLFAEKLYFLMEHPEIKTKLGLKAKDRVQEHFNISKRIEKIEKTLNYV